ncbi:PHB depolymerase family esterase [Actinokineospora sp. UTMC 2448]|uniref:extracellular catalytic domain type 1 short-chain-length polyhydroxyalkanoate depolymerase n=1 Tax=Actinokineospora sp. UTMC 2448 TaxID=2268449 RepID=UPI00216407B4|nr:PHB depolymerase family esterase [Actinokineospora sp. UTMC 2448]UVS82365.1 esterase, PHB depolymerase family [Actinokineospora sp. UTMC 2448]
MRAMAVVVLTLAALLVGAPARAATEVPWFGTNPGNLKMFRYTPSGLPSGRPVVVALHGCTQDASYGTNSGWTELAQRWGFTVVMPQQQAINNGNRCFNWFQSADTTRGWGEAESIAQMTRKALSDAGTRRAHVTGLSAGGGMTSVMLAAYPELFAAGGIVAGIPYGCAVTLYEAFSCMNPGKNLTPAQWGAKVRAASGHTGPWPVVGVWHGTADTTVAPANLREIVEQWTNVHGVPATPTSTDTVNGYPHARYGSAVETYTITGMGHGQPVDPGAAAGQCGRAAAYVLDVGVCAAWHMAAAWGIAG